jgi:hypothetical protein
MAMLAVSAFLLSKLNKQLPQMEEKIAEVTKENA